MSNYERVLYVSQEINPYLPENYMSYISRQLPQEAQDFGKEIRLFMYSLPPVPGLPSCGLLQSTSAKLPFFKKNPIVFIYRLPFSFQCHISIDLYTLMTPQYYVAFPQYSLILRLPV